MTREQIKRIMKKKIRTCTVGIHNCALCPDPIMPGERYHDGGLDKRIHSRCMAIYCAKEGL